MSPMSQRVQELIQDWQEQQHQDEQQLIEMRWYQENEEAEQAAFDIWLDSPKGKAWLNNAEPIRYETTASCWE